MCVHIGLAQHKLLDAPVLNFGDHQQPEVNYLSRFSPLLICLERSPLRGDRSRQIDLFENLDIVHIRLLVAGFEDLESSQTALVLLVRHPVEAALRHSTGQSNPGSGHLV